MREHPPLVASEGRIIVGQSAQPTGEPPEQPRADGLVGVAAAEETDPEGAVAESESADRAALTGAADLETGIGVDRIGPQDLVRRRIQPLRVQSSLPAADGVSGG